MNRLLLRSNRAPGYPTRLEVLFMNVKYLSIGTSFEGLTISEITPGEIDDMAPPTWSVPRISDLRWFYVQSASGSGLIAAGGVDTDESEAGPEEPSRFFMME